MHGVLNFINQYSNIQYSYGVVLKTLCPRGSQRVGGVGKGMRPEGCLGTQKVSSPGETLLQYSPISNELLNNGSLTNGD